MRVLLAAGASAEVRNSEVGLIRIGAEGWACKIWYVGRTRAGHPLSHSSLDGICIDTTHRRGLVSSSVCHLIQVELVLSRFPPPSYLRRLKMILFGTMPQFL